MPRHKVFMKSKNLPKVRNAYTYKEFDDTKDRKCIIQESSCAVKSLWLGLQGSHSSLEYAMHLDVRGVKELIEDLQSWLENAV